MLYPQYNDGPEPWPAHPGQPMRQSNQYQYDPEAQYAPYHQEEEEYVEPHYQQQYQEQGPKYVVAGSSDDGYFKYILVLLIGLVFVGGINVWKTNLSNTATFQTNHMIHVTNARQESYVKDFSARIAIAEKEEKKREEKQKKRNQDQYLSVSGGISIRTSGNVDPAYREAAMAMVAEKQKAERDLEIMRQQMKIDGQRAAHQSTDEASKRIHESGKQTGQAIKDISGKTHEMGREAIRSIADGTEKAMDVLADALANSNELHKAAIQSGKS